MKYRKKPVVIEAIQWNGLNTSEIEEFYGGMLQRIDLTSLPPIPQLQIPTLEVVHNASIGDYIIKGVKGEYYPCKPDIFEETYELVEE